MKDSKGLYSRCFEEYRLNDETVKKLQSVLLNILVDFKTVCDRYEIDYSLSYGSVLGAIRHQGFIPWDDDVDVMMRREEYERFREVFKRELSDKYELVEPLSDPHYVSKMVKIYKKGTTFVEISTAGVGGPDMIFIDLFLIDNVPAPGFWRFLKKNTFELLFKAASVCIDYRYPSPPILEKCKTNRELKRYYSLRRTLGFFFTCLGGMPFYLRACESMARQKKKTGWLGIPSDGDLSVAVFPAKVLTELTTAMFCGYEMKIPKDYDTYLRTIYGDYMQIPPPEKREYHCAYKISFGDW